MPSKYDPLSRHLESLDATAWQATFRDIERVLGFQLPASARNHRSWWHNNTIGHPQAPAWMDIGWKTTDVDMNAETLVFRRTGAPTARPVATSTIRPRRESAPLSSTGEKASSPRPSRPTAIPAKAGIQTTPPESFFEKLMKGLGLEEKASPRASRSSVIPAKVGIQRASEVRQLSSKSGLPLDIHHLMERLSQNRPIFHSEADFQHALAWQIHEAIPDSQVRLEYPFRYDDSPVYVDIWLPSETIAIELKYPTRNLELSWESERFLLVDHGAQPPRRYDFLKDVQRLERLVVERDATGGFAILLTNHPYYWESPTRGWRTAIDAAFRVHEGRNVTGELAWSERTGAGTKRSREDPIDIIGSYDLHWRDYSRLGGSNNQQFRYLAVAVQ